jgi:hypothetical protein
MLWIDPSRNSHKQESAYNENKICENAVLKKGKQHAYIVTIETVDTH